MAYSNYAIWPFLGKMGSLGAGHFLSIGKNPYFGNRGDITMWTDGLFFYMWVMGVLPLDTFWPGGFRGLVVSTTFLA
jgi:hypothetical protein